MSELNNIITELETLEKYIQSLSSDNPDNAPNLSGASSSTATQELVAEVRDNLRNTKPLYLKDISGWDTKQRKILDYEKVHNYGEDTLFVTDLKPRTKIAK